MAYLALLTDIGRIKLAAAAANNSPLDITHMALGDGFGAEVGEPDGYETELVNEVYRNTINSLTSDGAQFVADMVVPHGTGGWTVREMGLFDTDGDLIAYANTPAIEKPASSSGVVVDFRPTITVELEEPGSINVVVDANIISASQQWVSTNYLAKSGNLAELSDVATARINLGAGENGGLAQLDDSGKVPQSQLPPQQLSETHTASSEVEMLALAAAKGDMCVRTDLAVTYVLKSAPASTLANWIELQTSNAVSSVAGKTGTVTLEKADVGLDQVDNTADNDKPVSFLQLGAIQNAEDSAKSYTDNKINALTKSDVGLDSVDNTADINKPVSNAQSQAIAVAANTAQNNLDLHTSNKSSAHGATPAATINTFMRRDASGRAKVKAPSAAEDIANKEFVESQIKAKRLNVSWKTPSLNGSYTYHFGNFSPDLKYIQVTNATYLRRIKKNSGLAALLPITTHDVRSSYKTTLSLFYTEDYPYGVAFESDGELVNCFTIPCE